MKIKNVICIFIVLLFPVVVMAENRVTGEYGTYDNAVKIIQEVMKDYYIKEDKLQYNTSRAWFGKYSPEEATKQDNRYLVCSMYTYNVYVEAFGVSSFPASSGSAGIIKVTRDYYNVNKNNKEKLDGNFLIYYENTTKNNKEKYIYNKEDTINITVSDFAKLIQPGDLFTYSGHSMVAYQTVYRTDKKIWDVLILNSTGGASVPTRNYGASRIFYHLFPSSHGQNKIIDLDREGSVKYFWLSDKNSGFQKNNVITCAKDECSVIRPFYKGDNGKAIFNYAVLPSQYQKSELRTKYPGLYIEKVVNKIDNNSVYLNDELEYTITITNKSNTTYNGQKYSSFVIEETLDSNIVEYISSSNGGIIKNSNKIIWNINELASNKTVELKYKVKVRNNSSNIGKTITSIGVFKEKNNSEIAITTGTVENKIIPNISKPVMDYKTCYNNTKSSKKGLNLINEIYKCAYNIDLHFDDFKFDKLFVKDKISNQNARDAIRFNNNLGGNELLFKKMILNNLWSGIVEINTNGSNDEIVDDEIVDDEIVESKYFLPRWSGNDAKIRARNINNDFFKEGDILIYSINYSKTYDSLKNTKENGIYAYIYLNGKFIGVNGSGTTQRNEFTFQYYINNSLDIEKHLYSYYNQLTSKDVKEKILINANLQTLFDKDYYIILRPEIVIDDEIIKVNNSDNVKKKNQMILMNIDYGTVCTKSSLLKNISINVINEYQLNDASGKAVNSDNGIIGTDSKLIINNNEFPIVIKGDINGDGKISSLDYITIRNHSLNIQKISNISKTEAADVNNDNKISALDYVKIRNMIIGSK